LTNSKLMRKIITDSDLQIKNEESPWLDVKALARFEATSEDSRYPIESAFEQDGQGWRAVEVGEQAIRLVFNEPQRIQRIRLCFLEPDSERTQQFTLHWSTGSTSALKPLIQQQWNFSPTGSIIQIEDYEVDLNSVRMLQLIVSPEINSGPAVATLVSWHIA
jgi:hypothetical protein